MKRQSYLHHHSINSHKANKWKILGTYNPSPGGIMGISCLLESNFPTPSCCCREQHCQDGGKQRESAHQSQKSSAEDWVPSLSEQQTGDKSHIHTQTHSMSTRGCSARRIRDYREIKNCTEIILGFFFTRFSARCLSICCTAR